MKTKPFRYESESAMCAQFIAEIGPDWTAYAETGGFDILLSRSADGFQIGIEAKLRLNTAVINQALEDWYGNTPGPDCRAVLVPRGGDPGFGRIAAYIGFTIITIGPKDPYVAHGHRPALPDVAEKSWGAENWYDLCPTQRIELPEYVPDVAAGASAPLQLTKWKISAIKIAIILERRGVVTRADFQHIHIDHRRWIARENAWLVGSVNGYQAGPRLPDFKRQHPRVWTEIEADADKWMPPSLLARTSCPPDQVKA